MTNREEFVSAVTRLEQSGAVKFRPKSGLRDRLGNLGSGGSRKVNEGEVRLIRARWEEGEKLESIAAAFGITKAAVSMIGTRQRWKGVV